MVGSVLATGVQGVQSGINRVNEAATDIARAGTREPENGDAVADIAEAAVDLKVGENQVKASAAVIRTGDEVLGTLVDTLA